MAVNSMDYSGKDTVLDVVRTERARFFDIMDDPANWTVQTRCTDWQVRDIVSHMIDVTEGYLSRWDLARKGEDAPPPIGVLAMGETLNKNALAMRSLGREEEIDRLKSASNKMMSIFDSLTADEWGNFLVNHPYMGPLPTLFYPAFHVMDYGVHTWDMEWGLGVKGDHDKLNERTAGVLVPFMHVLMQSTVDQKTSEGLDIVYGIVVDGEWGGKWRVTVKDGAYTATPTDNLDDVQAIMHFNDASDFVLTTFQRIDASEASGDPEVVEKIRRLFFRI
jgi:uncharacterized protein (TIGR03083 family)